MEERTSESGVEGTVELEKLEDLFTEAQEKISSVSVTGKEIILIIGDTGVGKSTFINYLLKYPLKLIPNEQTGDEELRLEKLIPGTAEIGEINAGSKTIFPQTHERKEATRFVYCDTGGFIDTRGAAYQIAIYYSLRSLLATATHVKAIIMVFKEAQLDSKKGGTAIADGVKWAGNLDHFFKKLRYKISYHFC